jgi:hypothetical protein
MTLIEQRYQASGNRYNSACTIGETNLQNCDAVRSNLACTDLKLFHLELGRVCKVALTRLSERARSRSGAGPW